MDLMQIRKERGFSRKELAERSGINLRSLQDYEQGHKNISSAKGETLYRLSLALGCRMEELLDKNLLNGCAVKVDFGEGKNFEFELMGNLKEKMLGRAEKYRMGLEQMKTEIENQVIYSEKYKTFGKWKVIGEECFLGFMYNGELVQMPFRAKFNETTLPWLVDMARLEIEDYVEEDLFNKTCVFEGGSSWDEE